MDFAKKYPHPTKLNDPIELRWKRGYSRVEVWYRDACIQELKGVKKLQKGITFQHELLGKVTVKLSEKPIVLNLIINNYHSPSNSLHPKERMKGIGGWYYIPAIIYFLILSFNLLNLPDLRFVNGQLIFGLVMVFAFMAVHVLTIIFTSLKKYFFIYIGAFFYFLPWLFSTFSMLMNPIMWRYSMGPYIVTSVLTWLYGIGIISTVIRTYRYYKHQNALPSETTQLLDL